MNALLIKQVNDSPLKKKFLADQLGIDPSDLSKCLKGKKFLDVDKEEKLKNLLKMVS